MVFYRAQVAFPRTTADPADTQTNTTYWDSDDPGGGGPADIVSILRTFYQSIDHLMPDDLFGTTAEVRVYNMADPEPRFPVEEDTIALVLSSSAATIPPEISAVLSFHGSFESGVNRARRRGRIYLPTFVGMIVHAGGNLEWSAQQRDAVVGAAEAMRDNSVGGLNWAVFSPTTFAETGDLDTAFEDVVGGWFDSEPDIQRRRGNATGRVRNAW